MDATLVAQPADDTVPPTVATPTALDVVPADTVADHVGSVELDGAVVADESSPLSAACDSVPGISDADGTVVPTPSSQQHMWQEFERLWRQRSGSSHRLLEQVASALRARAQLERQYGAKLLDTAGEPSPEPQQSPLHEAVDTVMVNFRNRGQQCLDLAEEIEHDIVLTFEEVMKQHKEVSKKVGMDAQRLARYYQETRHSHDKLAAMYHSVCSDAELAGKDCLTGLAVRPSERTKLGLNALHLSKQARVAEHNYHASIEQANRAQALYDQQMPSVLAAMRDMEEKKGKCLRDGIMKLAVYETSWLRNLQYDLDTTVQAAEGANRSEDSQADGSSPKDGQVPPQKRQPAQVASVQLTTRPFWELGKPKSIPLTAARKVRLEGEAAVQQQIKAIQPLFHRLFKESLSEEAAVTVKDQMDQIQCNVGELRCRAALCQALRVEVLCDLPQGTTLEQARPLVVSPATFEMLVQLFTATLGFCDEQNDTWNGRDLMVLSQLFESHGDGGKEAKLLTRLYNHPLWNKVTFWEDMLLVGLCEAHSAEVMWRRSMQPGVQFVQVAMTAFLQKLVEYMLAFGIRPEEAKECIRTSLRKHAPLLGGSAETYSRFMLQNVDAVAAKPFVHNAAMPAPRKLEDGRAVDDGAGVAACDGVSTGEGAAPSPALEEERKEEEKVEEKEREEQEQTAKEEEEDPFEAVALGMKASFADAAPCRSPPPEEQETPTTQPSNTTATAAIGSSEPDEGGSGPCDQVASGELPDDLRQLGVDQRTVSEVFT